MVDKSTPGLGVDKPTPAPTHVLAADYAARSVSNSSSLILYSCYYIPVSILSPAGFLTTHEQNFSFRLSGTLFVWNVVHYK